MRVSDEELSPMAEPVVIPESVVSTEVVASVESVPTVSVSLIEIDKSLETETSIR